MAELCLNITQNCHDNGNCILSGLEYICTCRLRWDPTTNCSTSFHDRYNGTDTYYYVVGIIGFSILFILVLFEVFMDIITRSCSKLWKINFVFKLIATLTILTRLSTLCFWIYFDKVKLTEKILIIDQAILAVGNVCSFATYYGVILMWVALVATISELKKETTEIFIKSRLIFFVVLGINLPIQLVFSILYAVSYQAWATYIFFAAVILSLLGAMIWSSIYVIKLGFQLHSLNIPVASRKNYLVGITNLFVCVFIWANVWFVVKDSKNDHQRYLEGLTYLRFTEIVLYVFFILAMENYILLPREKNAKTCRKACCCDDLEEEDPNSFHSTPNL